MYCGIRSDAVQHILTEQSKFLLTSVLSRLITEREKTAEHLPCLCLRTVIQTSYNSEQRVCNGAVAESVPHLPE